MSSAPFDRAFTSFAIHSKLIAADSGAALTCANTSFFGWVCAMAGARPLARMPAMPALLASKARRESGKGGLGVLRSGFLAGLAVYWATGYSTAATAPEAWRVRR